MFKICKHKFNPVDKRGYQYCELCGKAQLIGLAECNHNWEIIRTLTSENIYTRNITHYIYVQQCTKCGEIKQFKTI